MNYINQISNCVTVPVEEQPTFTYNIFNNYTMISKTLFFGSLILIIVWAIGFLGFHIHGAIHILPVIALFGLMTRIFYNNAMMK